MRVKTVGMGTGKKEVSKSDATALKKENKKLQARVSELEKEKEELMDAIVDLEKERACAGSAEKKAE